MSVSTSESAGLAGRVLVVDDEAPVRFTLDEILSEAGFEVLAAPSVDAALGLLEEVDAVLTDLSMPGRDGFALLDEVRARRPSLPVILLTAHGSERTAVRALKSGAYDYLAKPFDVDEVVHSVRRAVEAHRLRVRTRRLEAERVLGRAIVARSAAMRRVLTAVERVADKDVTVLVCGETGTGKELVASLLHAWSRRSAGALVRFNCAAIPAELAEAELFGHARGAFTGAHAAREGYFQRADGGTLVLDEIGELAPAVQAKLLRALQEGELQPVGGRLERVDVRVVACGNTDLRAAVARGAFRADLYYRLAVVELGVPPLRERREDIPALIELFRGRYAERFGVDEVRPSAALVEALVAHPWPGNVRELENTMARLIALSSGRTLDLDALRDAAALGAGSSGAAAGPSSPGVAGPTTYRARLEAFERQLLADALAAAGGNQSEAARRLELSRSTLLEKLKRHGLDGRGG